MAHAPRKRVLACAPLILLWGTWLLGTRAWFLQKELKDKEDNTVLYFPPTVEFAQHMFNQELEDEFAYRVEHILNVRREQALQIVFFTTLQLRRTICKKFEDDLENCPFWKTPESSKTIICAFNVSTVPWVTQFQLLNKNCSESPP